MRFQGSLFAAITFYLLFFVPQILAKKVVIGYLENWIYARYPVSKIPFSKYTHIHYAFAIMINGPTPEWTDPQYVDTHLKQVVTAAHKKKVKCLISVGGWTGSKTFSSMAKSSSGRKKFIDWNIQQIKKFNTDGVDIDWEYPGRQGAGCNTVDASNDVKNFLTLLKELRAALDKNFGKSKKELTIAGHIQSFKTDKGAASKSLVTAIGKVLDRVNIMAYDIHGAWESQTGPNAPLKSVEKGGMDFNSAIDLWVSLGVPAKKLTGGLAFYGRSTTAKVDMRKSKSINQSQVSGVRPRGDKLDAPWQDPYCSAEPVGYSGIWTFGNLLSQGVLSSPTKAKSPWVRTWDSKSSTPWLFNPKTKIFISYDDPLSIAAKAKAAKSKGLAGVMVWAMSQDSSKNDLVNAIQANLN